MNSEERRVRIPYRLGTDQFCEYEEDGGEVCMGDMVTVRSDTYKGKVEHSDTYKGKVEHSGKLIYVTYEWLGYIDSVILKQELGSGPVECSCNVTFYRMEEEHGID